MKASTIGEFKASAEFENILKDGVKVKTMMESRYLQLDYHFLED